MQEMGDMSGGPGGFHKAKLAAPVHIAVSIGEADELRQGF
jgi:hypothetical protein